MEFSSTLDHKQFLDCTFSKYDGAKSNPCWLEYADQFGRLEIMEDNCVVVDTTHKKPSRHGQRYLPERALRVKNGTEIKGSGSQMVSTDSTLRKSSERIKKERSSRNSVHSSDTESQQRQRKSHKIDKHDKGESESTYKSSSVLKSDDTDVINADVDEGKFQARKSHERDLRSKLQDDFSRIKSNVQSEVQHKASVEHSSVIHEVKSIETVKREQSDFPEVPRRRKHKAKNMTNPRPENRNKSRIDMMAKNGSQSEILHPNLSSDSDKIQVESSSLVSCSDKIQVESSSLNSGSDKIQIESSVSRSDKIQVDSSSISLTDDGNGEMINNLKLASSFTPTENSESILRGLKHETRNSSENESDKPLDKLGYHNQISSLDSRIHLENHPEPKCAGLDDMSTEDVQPSLQQASSCKESIERNSVDSSANDLSVSQTDRGHLEDSTEEEYLMSVAISSTTEDPSLYLRSLPPMRPNRRSMSDLGFASSKPGLVRSGSRAMALLKHPMLRKRIARTMSLNPLEDNFDEKVCEKMSSNLEESFSTNFDSSFGSSQRRHSTSGEQRFRLSCSTSDLGLLKDLHSQLLNSTESLDSRVPEGVHTSIDLSNDQIMVSTQSNGIKNSQTLHDEYVHSKNLEDSDQNSHSVESHDQSALKSKDLMEKNNAIPIGASVKTLNAFKLPSFEEFKAFKTRTHRKYGMARSSSMALDFLVPQVETIEEEENNTDSAANDSDSVFGDSVKGDPVKSDDDRLDTITDTGYNIHGEKRRRKHHKKIVSHPHQENIFVRKSQSSADMRRMPSQLSTSIGGHKVKHDRTLVESHNDNYMHEPSTSGNSSVKDTLHSKLSNPAKYGLKVDSLHSVEGGDRIKSQTFISRDLKETHLSDYASDSNPESDLEDVFLVPGTLDIDNDNAETKGDNLITSDSFPVQSVQFSDSGCLVDRRSPDPESAKQERDSEVDITVPRSTSDLSDMFAEEQRKKHVKEKRTKPHRSDPLKSVEDKEVSVKSRKLSSRESKDHILTFLEEIKSNDAKSKSTSDVTVNSHKDPGSEVSLSSGMERADSGVRGESHHKDLVLQCSDCGQQLQHSPDVTKEKFLNIPPEGSVGAPVCESCTQSRTQRKKAIMEIIETESNYGNDLMIIDEEFYEPMRTSGLLSADNLRMIFSNIKELITVNKFFLTQLKDALHQSEKAGDTFLQGFDMGQLFLDSSNMLLAFESYCINQSGASVVLDQLVGSKELLGIFLQVAQREKVILRKMDLKAFLMVPVQRIMKYPLLLSRLHKATSTNHPDCENIIQAQHKIENLLELINSKTRGSTTVKLRRRASSMSMLRRSGEFDTVIENIEMHKVAMEALGWDRRDLHFVRTGRLLCSFPSDHLWAKRGKILKFTTVYGMLVTLGKCPSCESLHNNARFPQPCQVQDAALVLVKDKSAKPQLFRDPFPLKMCVIAINPEFPEVIEVQEANKDSILVKAENQKETDLWLNKLRGFTRDLGVWRRRRNALANIMLKDL